MRPRPGDRLVCRATDLDFEGRGVARLGGEEVHAEDLVPGEEAEVEIQHVSRQARRSFAVPLAPAAPPSPDRVPRACPPGIRCGGCVWQHVAYPAQLEHKRRRVEAALSGALPSPAEVRPVVPSPAVVGYRHKATYVLAGQPGGGVRLGAYAPRSHEWVDTSACRVVVPVLQAAVPLIAAALGQSGLAVFDEQTRTGHLRYVVARANRAGDVLVGFVTATSAPREPLADAARWLCGQAGVRGAVWLPHDATSGAILGPRVVPLAGAASITESIAGVPVEVGIDTFVQIHLDQAEALYRRLAELVESGPETRAVDLYCGVGAIAFSLAHRGAQVTGIERNPSSIDAATAAAERAGLADRIRFEAAPADEAEVHLEGATVLVVNPPRQGLTPAVRALIISRQPDTVAYVSCGPESLARNLAELMAAGYRIAAVEPFDLMPGTAHVETLVVLRR